jgi:multicomponent K+:H+ antiporter subunit E
MISRILPHPLLTLLLTGVWQMLVNTVTVGTLILGLIFGILIPILTSAYWPNRPKLRRPLKVIAYVMIVLWDICVANLVVARTILFRRNSELRSNWVTIPLDLNSPEAITVLAGTITMTPGTVSSDISACGRALLVHCLDAPDPDAVREEIKYRYERRLKEIFE